MYDILKACHNGPFGGHFVDKRTAAKVLHRGYYWPTLFKDANKYVIDCDSFQWMGSRIEQMRSPYNPRCSSSHLSDGPQTLQGLSHPRSGRKGIFWFVHYVTKCVEAKSLYQASEKFVIDFLFEDIFTRFGVPREIVTDHGAQFTSKAMQSLVQQYQIKHRKSIPYHPQANGLIESTNKVLEAIITKIVQLHHTDRTEKLLEALWAYRIAWRTTTGFTRYELVYGKQVLLSIEFQIKTFRRAMQLGLDLS